MYGKCSPFSFSKPETCFRLQNSSMDLFYFFRPITLTEYWILAELTKMFVFGVLSFVLVFFRYWKTIRKIALKRNHTFSSKGVMFFWWFERIVATFTQARWSIKENNVGIILFLKYFSSCFHSKISLSGT